MPEHNEMRLLCDYLPPAAVLPQAVNTWLTPTPAAVGGELEADERGEVVCAEIYSPFLGAVDEELRKVVPVLDGHNYGAYISLSGIRTNVMAPPKDRIWAGRLYSFGEPHSNDPLKSTTLKYKQNVTVSCLAGPAVGGITQPYRVRLWGYVYKAAEIPQVFGTMQFPAYLTDKARNRTIVLNKVLNPDGTNRVTAENWLTLPGGKDQAIPKINPFARFAYNLLATDGQQGDYQFRFTGGGVIDEQENMYWEFDDKDALLIKSLGIAARSDAFTLGTLARTGLRISGDYHPKGPTTRASLYPTDININELNYGLWPVAIAGVPFPPPLDVFVAIPKLERPYLIWNEIGYVVIRDNGAPVALNTVVAALTGLRLEMRS